MFIEFIEIGTKPLLNVATGKFVDVENCFYQWRHVARNSNGAAV